LLVALADIARLYYFQNWFAETKKLAIDNSKAGMCLPCNRCELTTIRSNILSSTFLELTCYY